MRGALAALALLVGCAAPAPAPAVDPAAAQHAVDATVARHPEIVRLTVHAVPAGGTASVIVACNLAEKIGAASHAEDVEAMTSGRTTVLREGALFDVTAPLRAPDGAAFAATGITLAMPPKADEAAARSLAGRIAVELEAALRAFAP